MTEIKKEDHARDQAASQLESVIAMVNRLRHAEKCQNESEDCMEGFGQFNPYIQTTANEYHDEERARTSIEENALSVDVRSAWTSPHEMKPSEYQIILCTGGPAVRITGNLNEYSQPSDARMEYQDWFTPWKEYHDGNAETYNGLLDYAQQFYFGE